MQTMEQYNSERAAQSNDKLEQLKKLLKSNPKMKKTELATKLAISRQHLYRLLKEI